MVLGVLISTGTWYVCTNVHNLFLVSDFKPNQKTFIFGAELKSHRRVNADLSNLRFGSRRKLRERLRPSYLIILPATVETFNRWIRLLSCA